MSVSISLQPVQPGKSTIRAPFAKALQVVWAWRQNLEDRAQIRHFLERADDRMLKDVALTRATLADEAGRPFWQN